MENLYEDMGHIIGRYYGVSELSEEEVSKRLGIRSEELVGNQHKLDLDKDGDIGSDDLAKLRAGKKTNESAIHEGTDIYNNNKVQITKFAGKNEQMIQINSARYNGSGDHIVMTNDEFIKMLKNSPKLLNQLK